MVFGLLCNINKVIKCCSEAKLKLKMQEKKRFVSLAREVWPVGKKKMGVVF